MHDLSGIVKANDIRGVVPEAFDASIARALGAATADLLAADGGRRVALGRDMRESSPDLSRAFAEGVTRRGMDVLDIGMCATDTLYYVSGIENIGGAMFTASHNPSHDNGIKLCRPGAAPLGSDTGLEELRRIAEQYLREGLPEGGERGAVQHRDVLADYAAYLRDLVDMSNMGTLKVVVDAGNGMAGLTTPAVLGTAAGLPDLGLDMVLMFGEPDGSFPNHEPNPLVAANLVDLQAAVVAEQADVGLAFDGDADRCFVIDERGGVVSPSAVTTIVALQELDAEKAAGRQGTIVHNLITSRAVPEYVQAAGGRAVRSRVGHSFIKEQMAAHNAVFGGEHSGHYYFREFFYADTGMLAALHLLAVLGDAEQPLSLSQLAEVHTPYSASGELNSTVADIGAALDLVRALFADDIDAGTVQVDTLDGLTISHWEHSPRWWLNVRGSNTEPLLRLNVEAEDEDIMIKVRDGVLAALAEHHR